MHVYTCLCVHLYLRQYLCMYLYLYLYLHLYLHLHLHLCLKNRSKSEKTRTTQKIQKRVCRYDVTKLADRNEDESWERTFIRLLLKLFRDKPRVYSRSGVQGKSSNLSSTWSNNLFISILKSNKVWDWKKTKIKSELSVKYNSYSNRHLTGVHITENPKRIFFIVYGDRSRIPWKKALKIDWLRKIKINKYFIEIYFIFE